MDEGAKLPAVNAISVTAPLGWLAGGWGDLWQAPTVFLCYGFVVALLSGGIVLGVALTGVALWSFTLAAGFVFIAPMLAMGVYEGGRLLEHGKRPTLGQVALVRSAFRRDVALLGLALLIMFAIWIELALVTVGLATNRLDRSPDAFIVFAISTPAGHIMLTWGTAIGGALAWVVFSFVVVSAPMLLDPRHDIFVATVTSVRCVVRNTIPMIVWAAIIAAIILLSVATCFIALIVTIPWLGLASWRAYRALVTSPIPIAPQTLLQQQRSG